MKQPNLLTRGTCEAEYLSLYIPSELSHCDEFEDSIFDVIQSVVVLVQNLDVNEWRDEWMEG